MTTCRYSQVKSFSLLNNVILFYLTLFITLTFKTTLFTYSTNEILYMYCKWLNLYCHSTKLRIENAECHSDLILTSEVYRNRQDSLQKDSCTTSDNYSWNEDTTTQHSLLELKQFFQTCRTCTICMIVNLKVHRHKTTHSLLTNHYRINMCIHKVQSA